MNREHRDRFAERLLDQAIAQYSDAEPRDGFEGRIIANLSVHEIVPFSAWRRFWWVPVTCAVALIIAISVSRPAAKNAVSTPAIAVTRPSLVQPQTPKVAMATKQITAVQRQRVRKTAEPRKPQFLAPMPSAEQEQLLAAYLNATPTQELLAVAADQREWRERIQRNAEADQSSAPSREINHLQFPPLESGSTEASAYGAR